MERREGGLHSPALLRLVAQPGLPLLDAVHAGQHLLLQVVDLTLEQVFEAVRLHRVVTSAELLSWDGEMEKGVKVHVENEHRLNFLCYVLSCAHKCNYLNTIILLSENQQRRL